MEIIAPSLENVVEVCTTSLSDSIKLDRSWSQRKSHVNTHNIDNRELYFTNLGVNTNIVPYGTRMYNALKRIRDLGFADSITRETQPIVKKIILEGKNGDFLGHRCFTTVRVYDVGTAEGYSRSPGMQRLKMKQAGELGDLYRLSANRLREFELKFRQCKANHSRIVGVGNKLRRDLEDFFRSPI